MMVNQAERFSRRSNENLLQLWSGRDGLVDDDIEPLREELEKRGLSKELEEMDGQVPTRDIYGKLPRGPLTFLGLSVVAWWLRELWLRHRTKDGIQVDATIESTQRTRATRVRKLARAELVYSYESQGRQYTGRVVRDFSYNEASANSLVYDHHADETIPVIICREDPGISYFPSGLGAFDPVFFGLGALLAWGSAIAILGAVLIGLLRIAP
jgi:hypothetical protein